MILTSPMRATAAHVRRARGDLLAVLTYHRVAPLDEAPWLHPGLISATPESFAQQVDVLRSSYRVVSIDDVLDARRHGAHLPPRSVLVTFDDAYRDFTEHAWPVLRDAGVPVALFVPTAFPGDPRRRFWWDRLHHALATTTRRQAITTVAGVLPLATAVDRHRSGAVLRRHLKTLAHDTLDAEVARIETLLDPPGPQPPPSVLDWAELNQLAAAGVTLGAHSRTHPLLNRVPRWHRHDEIVGSIQDLRLHTGRAPATFAYPGGAYDAETLQDTEEAGVTLGFSTDAGLNDLRQPSWLRLGRLNVGRSTTPSVLRLRLMPALSGLERIRAR